MDAQADETAVRTDLTEIRTRIRRPELRARLMPARARAFAISRLRFRWISSSRSTRQPPC